MTNPEHDRHGTSSEKPCCLCDRWLPDSAARICEHCYNRANGGGPREGLKAEKLKDALEAAEQTIEETAFILAYRPGDISHGRAFDLALARLRRDNPNAGRVAIFARKENSP